MHHAAGPASPAAPQACPSSTIHKLLPVHRRASSLCQIVAMKPWQSCRCNAASSEQSQRARWCAIKQTCMLVPGALRSGDGRWGMLLLRVPGPMAPSARPAPAAAPASSPRARAPLVPAATLQTRTCSPLHGPRAWLAQKCGHAPGSTGPAGKPGWPEFGLVAGWLKNLCLWRCGSALLPEPACSDGSCAASPGGQHRCIRGEECVGEGSNCTGDWQKHAACAPAACPPAHTRPRRLQRSASPCPPASRAGWRRGCLAACLGSREMVVGWVGVRVGGAARQVGTNSRATLARGRGKRPRCRHGGTRHRQGSSQAPHTRAAPLAMRAAPPASDSRRLLQARSLMW